MRSLFVCCCVAAARYADADAAADADNVAGWLSVRAVGGWVVAWPAGWLTGWVWVWVLVLCTVRRDGRSVVRLDGWDGMAGWLDGSLGGWVFVSHLG